MVDEVDIKGNPVKPVTESNKDLKDLIKECSFSLTKDSGFPVFKVQGVIPSGMEWEELRELVDKELQKLPIKYYGTRITCFTLRHECFRAIYL